MRPFWHRLRNRIKNGLRTGATQPSTGVRTQEGWLRAMKRIFLTAPLFLIIILLPQVLNANSASGTPVGEELFKRYCAGCHGENAIGQDPAQPAGGWDEKENRLAPALNGTGHAWHHSPELLFEYIQQGSIDKTSPMPSFGDVLSESQISEIISYFQSMWPNKIMEQYEERFTDIKE